MYSRLFLASALLTSAVIQSRAQYFVPTSAPHTNWAAITCSADGSTVVAASYGVSTIGVTPGQSPSGGLVYISTDSGATWLPTSAPATNYSALACSADASTIIAAAGYWYVGAGFWNGSPQPLFVSTNSGATWVQTAAPLATWGSVACSSNGVFMMAANGSDLWLSTNAGAAWYAVGLTGCSTITCSADGAKLAALAGNNICTSTNFGTNWTVTTIAGKSLLSLASSADGTKLAIGCGYGAGANPYGPIYTSIDSGKTWFPTTSPAAVCLFLSSSGDGRRLTGFASHIYVSTNSGASWTDSFNPLEWWVAPAFSADGKKLFIAANLNDTIYTYEQGPRLQISNAATNLLLSWPAYGTGLGLGVAPDPTTNFVVQQSISLGGAGWSDAGLVPVVTNFTDQILVPASAGQLFYRLKGY